MTTFLVGYWDICEGSMNLGKKGSIRGGLFIKSYSLGTTQHKD